MNENHIVILIVISVLLLFVFFNGFVTLLVLLPYFSFTLNSVVFSPDCTPSSVEGDDCYDRSKVSGGEILNCLHGGTCPKGVSYVEDEIESTVEPIVSAPTVSPTPVLSSDTNDDDSDGIINSLDECVTVPETVNGFKDTDGCPETYTIQSSVPVTQYVQPTLTSIFTDPPDLSDVIFQSYSDLPQTESSVNLNESVNNASVLIILVMSVLLVSVLIISRKKIKKLI